MLDESQIRDAIAQLASSLQGRVDRGDWDFVSVRGLMYELGYEDDDVDQAIRVMAKAGFGYCIDPIILTGDGHRPDAQVCHWMPDQLLSRIDCLYITG